eukprot:CAMPEP_0177680250 /NCGR_PEP_ID=MMETSP0447-20121125/30070_1 /TAXON_ID=0 /ORGANISM="Stygamoeba regulata, Strain BSH-02190019" /LENGTH=88 /DNA_ID=CAMNT_0019189563 /DNA_START=31 /DNA_END=297 /DNA_ORIENTATION=-
MAAEPTKKHIGLKFADPDTKSIVIKSTPTTRLSRLFKAYANQVHKPEEELFFLYMGRELDPNHTPKSYDMEDGDEIQVKRRQQGGSSL